MLLQNKKELCYCTRFVHFPLLKRLHNSAQCYDLVCIGKNGIPSIHECISIDENYHVKLSF